MEIPINQAAAIRILNGKEKILLASCLKCGCFNTDIPQAYKKDSIFLKSLNILADTNCSKWGFKLTHMPSKTMDSLGLDIYNVILLKLKDGEYHSRVVNSKEGRKLLEIAKQFFEN